MCEAKRCPDAVPIILQMFLPVASRRSPSTLPLCSAGYFVRRRPHGPQ
jgi:hypothetical protein